MATATAPSSGISAAQWQSNIESLRRNMDAVLFSALDDPLTIEVFLNPDGCLWQERLGEEMKPIGKMERHRAEAIIRFVASSLNETITGSNPLLNGEFPLDGSRFAAVLPPVVCGPALNIRCRASRVFSLEEYVASGTMNEQQRDIICESVEEHLNILVIGGTSSGKTTLTNTIIGEMVALNPIERIFIFEDTGEIQCAGTNTIFFRTTTEVTMGKLLEQALRMRPDRICVGEVRNHAALDLMDCWNTGHDGGVATLHANSALRGLSRLRGLITRHEFAPSDIEDVIGESVQRIIFIKKTPAGRRIKEILGVDGYSKSKQEYEIIKLSDSA